MTYRRLAVWLAWVGLAWVGLAWVGLMAAGCRHASVSLPPFGVSDEFQYLPGQVGPGLVADPASPIADVPRPVGFKALVGASRSSLDGPARRVHHVYQGVGAAGEAVAFYRQQLAAHGWRALSMRSGGSGGGHADLVLRYVKGPEELSVLIGSRGRVTTLVIDIAGRGDGGEAGAGGPGVRG